MVTQQSWMFLRSFAELRKGVLEQQTIECLAHLGPRAFEEISGEVVNVALFVLVQAPPGLTAPPMGCAPRWAQRVGRKRKRRRHCWAGRFKEEASSCGFLSAASAVPCDPAGAALSYWLRGAVLRAACWRDRSREVADVCQGLADG